MAGHPRSVWFNSAILTSASLLAAAGNYLFQAIVGRWLPLAEFGYLNAALSLTALLTLGMTAANQAVAHHLARHQAVDDQARIDQLKAASSAFLLRVTVAVSLLAVVALYPVARFFQVPRTSVGWLVLSLVLANVWGGLTAAWCAGLGQFTFLAGLGLAGVAVRLFGTGFVALWPVAESGIGASVVATVMTVGLVLGRDLGQVQWRGSIQPVMNREFLLYLLAAAAVVGGQFLFLQSDLLVAQRHFAGPALGEYSAAGLIGRAVVFLASPVLVVLFTTRSGVARLDAASGRLLMAYFGLLLCGVLAVTFGNEWLCRLLLGRVEEPVRDLMPPFARAMLGIGLLQAAGAYLLASRRLAWCLAYGILAVGYAGILMWYGGTGPQLVRLMQTCGFGGLAVLGGLKAMRELIRRATGTARSQ